MPTTPDLQVLNVRQALRSATLVMLLGMNLESVAGADLVISQVYGGGGNSGALFRNDFVELFNRGTNAQSLAGWSLQYGSAAGSSWQSVALNGSVDSGGYFLIQLAAGANGANLPAPDVIGNLGLGASAGKVALSSSTNLLSGACPTGGDIVDLVGYGAGANCFEGSGPASTPANATAVWRASGGCVDSGDNAVDLFVAAPFPRNTLSPPNVCESVATAMALHDIQGAGAVSPFVGRWVMTTTNIVTGIRNNGFFVQAPDAETDNDPNTSEAVFVATPDSIPSAAVVGNPVVISGIVEEFRPASDPASPPRTQIIHATVTLVGMGRSLPAPLAPVFTDLVPSGGFEQLERFEAMRLRVNSLTVAGPTEGFITETNANGISDGIFYGVLTGQPRPLREPGIPLLDPLPAGAPLGVPRFDMNPERLRVDSNAQPGAPRIEVTAGAVVSNLVGVLDFERQLWTLLPNANSARTISGNLSALPVPAPSSNEFTVASFNLERFFDTIDDPSVDETILTLTAFNGRLNKASLAIRNVLHLPDILGIEEVENLPTLQAIASKLNSDAAAAGQPSPGYAAWLEEGNDPGGIDVGFLVRTSRVAVLQVAQLGKMATYLNPLNGQAETLNDRPSLLLRCAVSRPGTANALPVTVILNHLRSLSGIDDPADGARVRAKRRAQAEYLAGIVQQRQAASPSESLVLIGDFNAFPFNDGYVDTLGTIMGTPTPAGEVTLASPDLVSANLLNLADRLAGPERYSYNFSGNAQALDHILVSTPMQPRVTRYLYARCNADFPESYRSNFDRPERVSDHDVPVAWFGMFLSPMFTEVRREWSGRVELFLRGDPGQTAGIDTSPDLENWERAGTVTFDDAGVASFAESNLTSEQQRFYRASVP